MHLYVYIHQFFSVIFCITSLDDVTCPPIQMINKQISHFIFVWRRKRDGVSACSRMLFSSPFQTVAVRINVLHCAGVNEFEEFPQNIMELNNGKKCTYMYMYRSELELRSGRCLSCF